MMRDDATIVGHLGEDGSAICNSREEGVHVVAESDHALRRDASDVALGDRHDSAIEDLLVEPLVLGWVLFDHRHRVPVSQRLVTTIVELLAKLVTPGDILRLRCLIKC